MLDWYDNFYIKWGQKLAEKLENVLWITPNGISYFRLLGCIPQFACFYLGGFYYVVGGILNEVLYLVDRTDGALARVRGTTSQYGHWIEVIGDRLVIGTSGLFGLFVALGVWRETGDILIWILLFFTVYAKFADRAILTMNLEDKSPDGVMERLQEDNNEIKQKKIYKLASKMDTWHYEIVIICALLYYPLKAILTIHPIMFGMILSTLMVQVNWLGRLYVSLRFFIRNKFV